MLLEGLQNLGLDDINPSVVYRSLRDMEERGWVTSEWEHEDTQGPPRRVYTLTMDGKSISTSLQTNLQQVKQIIDRILIILN
jgi:DNA-binding PadR family transcriptional regulator